MKKNIFKFNLILIITIITTWIFVPNMFPKTSTVCDVIFCRCQVGLHNVFIQSVNAESHSATQAALTFDDGFSCVYDNVIPILDEYDYTASIAVIGNRIGKKDYLTYKQLSILYRKGYEILNHSYRHIQYEELSQAELLREYKLNRLLLKAGGFFGSNSIIIAPGGAYYDNHVSIADEGEFTAVRTLNKFYIHSIEESCDICIINVYGSRSIDDIKRHIDKAKSEEKDIIMVFHKIVDNPPKKDMYISIDTFNEIISYLNEKDISAISYKELIYKTEY